MIQNNNEQTSSEVGHATVCKIGQLAIFKYHSAPKKQVENNNDGEPVKIVKKNIHFLYNLDNSGSMSRLTRKSAEIFCNGFIGKIPGCSTQGTLVIFDSKAQVLIPHFTNPAVVNATQFPDQGLTNITAGVELALDTIISTRKDLLKKDAELANNTTHCLVFLSDGAHNQGPVLDDAFIKKWHAKVEVNKVKLVVIVVGIGSNDTSLGMKIKTGLENVRINGLDSVYYAANGQAMQEVLDKLVNGLSKSLASSKSVNFTLKGGRGGNPRFLENSADAMSVFVNDEENDQESPSSSTSHCLPVFMMGNAAEIEDNKEQEELLAILRRVPDSFQEDNNNNLSSNNKMEEYRAKIAEGLPQLFVNGTPVPVRIVDFTENDISIAIQHLMPTLSQERVAYGVDRIAEKRALLSKHLDFADELVTVLEHRAKRLAELKNDNKNKNTAGDETQKKAAAITGSQRARMLKAAKQTRHRFAEERASLNRLVATLADNSAELASFLNGASRKYAAKALMRSDMVGNVSAETVLKSLRDNAFISELKSALEKDKALMAKRSSETNENNMACSILSLQTAMETYEDWITMLDSEGASAGTVVDPSDVYSCLVAFSLFAHPVAFAQTNAAQMQPLQTFCLDIDPTNLDTGSLFLAKQGTGNFDLKGQMGKKIEQAFALVDPSCPNLSSLILRRSQIAQINNSVNICSDLFMVHPEQSFAQHVHTFTKAVQKYAAGGTGKSRAYLNLAVKILYSFRRMYPNGKSMTDKQSALFKRWFIENSTITTSEEDACDHPYALPFLLAVCDLDSIMPEFSSNSNKNKEQGGEDDETKVVDSCSPYYVAADAVLSSRAPVMNLLNEWFARKCKMILSRYAHMKNHSSTSQSAHMILRKYFGVNEQNSPAPLDDVLANEPSVEAVKENCQHWVADDDLKPEVLASVFLSTAGGGDDDAGNESSSSSSTSSSATSTTSVAENVVKKEIEQIYLAYKFARALQLYFASKKSNWKDLMSSMEQDLDVPSSLVNFIDKMDIEKDDVMEKFISRSMFVNNTATSSNKNKTSSASAGPSLPSGEHQFYQAMVAQGLLYHESSTRKNVDEHDITDPVTLQEMVISLRMSVYFDRCQIKRAQYMAIIGDVSYANALASGESEFAGMLGTHTHGLNRQQFWAFLRACEGCDAKAHAFRDKSNDTLKSETAFKCALGRAQRKMK